MVICTEFNSSNNSQSKKTKMLKCNSIKHVFNKAFVSKTEKKLLILWFNTPSHQFWDGVTDHRVLTCTFGSYMCLAQGHNPLPVGFKHLAPRL